VDEALGRTSDENRYVYLSDGGHFENIGLYEAIRRRCHYVVIVDASCDPDRKLEDLGNAIRKVGIDLGVAITIDNAFLSPKADVMDEAQYCLVGTIRYSAVDTKFDDKPAPNGMIVYIKPARHADDPVDVYNYRKMRGQFPHQSTVNQWFTESQFESYRRLGQATIDRICRAPVKALGSQPPADTASPPRQLTIDEFFRAAKRHVGGMENDSFPRQDQGDKAASEATVVSSGEGAI
jgi:hypothetical protein